LDLLYEETPSPTVGGLRANSYFSQFFQGVFLDFFGFALWGNTVVRGVSAGHPEFPAEAMLEMLEKKTCS